MKIFLIGKNPSQEVKNCLIPNCVTKTWKSMRQETYDDNETSLSAVFDSGKKVCI